MASRNSERKSHTRLDEEQLLRDHRTLVEMEKREKKRVRRAWHWGTFRHVLLVLLTLILAIVTIVVMVVGQFLRGDAYRGILWGLSTSQWISIALVVINTILLLRKTVKNGSNEPEQEESPKTLDREPAQMV